MTQQKNQNSTSNRQTMTTNRATDVIKIIVLIIGGVLIFTSPFWHEPFRYQKNDLNKLRATHNQKIKDSETVIYNLRQGYKSESNNQHYISSLHAALDQLEAVKKSNKAELTKLQKETRVLDWKNTYIFLIALGTRIPIIIFPILLIYLFKLGLIKLENNNIKISFVLFCSGSLAVGIFWIIWVFWPWKNLPIESYTITVIGSSLLISAAITHFMFWRKLKMERLINIIQHLNSVFINTIPNNLKKSNAIEDFEVVYDEIVWDALEFQADEG